MQRFMAVAMALLLAGCTGKTIEVGPVSGGPEAGPPCYTPDSAPPDDWPEPDGCMAASNLPLVGTWNGYFANAGPPWDSLRLVILGASEAGGLCGTLTIGMGKPLPPATNPDVGYPPGMEIVGFGVPLVQGYSFTLLQGTVQASRVRFGVAYAQVWRGWCALQSVCPDWLNTGPVQILGCAPNGPAQASPGGCTITNPMSGEMITIDCNKYHLCSPDIGVCDCTQAGCAARAGSNVTFDMLFQNDELSGSGSVSGAPVRFSRAE